VLLGVLAVLGVLAGGESLALAQLLGIVLVLGGILAGQLPARRGRPRLS